MVAERLPNGVVLDDGLSVALVGFDRSAQVTKVRLAFRRIRERQWPKTMELVLSDDRGNDLPERPIDRPTQHPGRTAQPGNASVWFHVGCLAGSPKYPRLHRSSGLRLKITVPTGRSFHERNLGDAGREGRAISWSREESLRGM